MLGDEGQARCNFAEALQTAEKIGSRRILWRIYASLSRLEQDKAQKALFRKKAREILHFIGDHTGSEVLRSSFLNLP